MYLNAYADAVRRLAENVVDGQRERIEAAGEAVADSMTRGGAPLLMDTAGWLAPQVLGQPGSLMALAPLACELRLDNPMPLRSASRSIQAATDLEQRTAALALSASYAQPGDTLIINADAGADRKAVAMALEAGAAGITTVGIASHARSEAATSGHASGKMLHEAVDIAIANGAPVGDAMVDVSGNERICPASAMGAAMAWWAIQAAAMMQLQARDIQPSVWRSELLGGREIANERREIFLKKGI